MMLHSVQVLNNRRRLIVLHLYASYSEWTLLALYSALFCGVMLDMAMTGTKTRSYNYNVVM